MFAEICQYIQINKLNLLLTKHNNNVIINIILNEILERKMSINQKESNDAALGENDELFSLIESAKSGDYEAFAKLRIKYTPLLEGRVIKFTSPDMMPQDIEDMRQEAFVIFCNAVCNFDPENGGVEFGLYAKICIENGLSSFVRSYFRRRSNAALPLESAEDMPDVNSIDFLQAVIDREHTEELVRSIKGNLSDYENRVWWMYVSGMSVSEIAARIGGEPKSVSNAIYRIRKKLRAIVRPN